jgi:hypothetical protein
VDGRFARHADAAKNKSMVSKWMRNLVAVFSDARESAGVLREFFDKLTTNPPGGGQDGSRRVDPGDEGLSIDTRGVVSCTMVDRKTKDLASTHVES